MLHILFAILISLGAANLQVVEQPREFTKDSIEPVEVNVLSDSGEDHGGW
ncbi:MAG: nuclear pore complex Nup192/Nup205 family protein [Saprospiraceae bacterium]|nr:nuclear pore complex Nup192/Nup205 family protein [Saprospiraceae bacterium]